ncbi:hypothetical protein [Paenibacillus sp. BIC5C1]|uniref:hypothetical protein n=1 Tax=Paenibacillus sp. BIC5C1 TaxID=3078263 RepID=UPI0028F0B2A8|nr:hypothetical protein [Paenibacillus sp. BIC5C1]
MKRLEFLDILTRDRNLPKSLRRRTNLKRLSLLLMLLFTLLMILMLFRSLYVNIFGNIDKMSYWSLSIIGGWLLSIIGVVWSDSYNPISKVGKFNNQLFVLIELLILEIEKSKTGSYHLTELTLLFKRYLYRMSVHANSIYVFENDEISSNISKLADISSNKLRNVTDKKVSVSVLNFYKTLNNIYESKINERHVDKDEFSMLLKYVDEINHYKPEPNKSNLYLKSIEFLQRNKKKVLISCIIVFGLIGLILKLLGMNDSKYIEYFLYSTTIIGLILGALSLKEND